MAEKTKTAKSTEKDENGTAWPMAALGAVPKLLNGPLADIRTIAQGIQVLPELARSLSAIQRAVESMDSEVKQMRRSVESMAGDVARLHPRIDELQNSVRPMRRLGRRFGRQEDLN